MKNNTKFRLALFIGQIVFFMLTFQSIIDFKGPILLYTLLTFIMVTLTILSLQGKIDISDESKKQKEIRLKEYNIEQRKRLSGIRRNKNKFIDKYGKLSNQFYLRKYSDSILNNTIKIFEEKSVIIIQGKVFNFNDIISFKLTDDKNIIYQDSVSTSKTSTSSGSMIGRAAVGGVLLGGVGAILGGATAKKNTTTITTPYNSITYHNYKVHIIVNSISDPQIILEFDDNEEILNEFISVLSVIIKRNIC